MSKGLSKIQHPNDEIVNRVQDNLVGTLNPILKQVQAATSVTGSRGGNAALASLLSALARAGIIKDNTTA